MINFCLMVILLSALRNIMYQIDADTIKAIDDKLETALLTVAGFFMFISEVIKPSKTELALYQKQKELALENAHNICSKAKSAVVAVYGKYTDKKITTQLQTKNQKLRLLPNSNENNLLDENNCDVA